MKAKLIKQIMLIAIVVLSCHQSNAQLANRIEMTKDYQLLGLGTQYKIQSDILKEERPVIISLPIAIMITKQNIQCYMS